MHLEPKLARKKLEEHSSRGSEMSSLYGKQARLEKEYWGFVPVVTRNGGGGRAVVSGEEDGNF